MHKPLTVLSVLLTLTACGDRGGESRDTLVIQQSADYPTLDPVMTYDSGSGQFVENLYETLVAYEGSSVRDLTPRLATKWTQSDGGRTWTFDLRENVKFHSGNTFGCDDAAYSLRRALVVNNPDSWTWFLSESLLGTASNAKDDDTITWDRITTAVNCNDAGQLVLRLPQVDPAFLAKLAYVGASVVDAEHAAKIGEWDGTEKTWRDWIGRDLNDSELSKQPSGTGAYSLVRRDANATLLKANAAYWGDQPKIGEVIVQRVPELATRLEALKQGDADFVEIGPRPNLEQLRGAQGVTILDDLPNNTASTLFMNQRISDPDVLGSGKLDGQGIPANFFSDVNVRRAFSHAFDADRYIKEVQQGKGVRRTMALPDIFPGYSDDVPTYAYDPKQAEADFKKAFGGQVWRGGFTLTARYRAGNTAQQTAMEILKRNIEALNPKFKMNIEAKQWAEMLEDSQSGKEAMIAMAWAPDYADPDNFMYTFYSSNGYYHSRLNYRDAQVDALLDRARTRTDPAERDALYRQVGERAYQTAPFILIPAGVNFTAYRSDLRGVGKDTYNPMLSFSGPGTSGTLWRQLSRE